MIIQLLIQILIGIITIIFSWLPSIETLPFGVDGALTLAVSYFKGATETFPYLEIVWTCFGYLLGFEILLIIVKFFLGNRTPAHNAN